MGISKRVHFEAEKAPVEIIGEPRLVIVVQVDGEETSSLL
jgi:hypothetical protein